MSHGKFTPQKFLFPRKILYIEIHTKHPPTSKNVFMLPNNKNTIRKQRTNFITYRPLSTDCGGESLYTQRYRYLIFEQYWPKYISQNLDKITSGKKWAWQGFSCPPILLVIEKIIDILISVRIYPSQSSGTITSIRSPWGKNYQKNKLVTCLLAKIRKFHILVYRSLNFLQ